MCVCLCGCAYKCVDWDLRCQRPHYPLCKSILKAGSKTWVTELEDRAECQCTTSACVSNIWNIQCQHASYAQNQDYYWQILRGNQTSCALVHHSLFSHLTCLPLFPGRPVGPLFPGTPGSPFGPCSPCERRWGIISLNHNLYLTYYQIILTFCPSIPGKPIVPLNRDKMRAWREKVISSASRHS